MAASAAFFDLDKTVIATSSTLAFGRSFHRGGLVNRRAMLKGAYAQFVYLVAGADASQMDQMRASLQKLCAGWPVEQVSAIVAEALHDLITPQVYAEALAVIAQHQAAGRDVVIVSSSGEEVVRPIGAMLGVDHVVATRMEVAGGCYTGEIAFYAYAEGKAIAMRELAQQRGYDLAECFAYSDSATDVPMLEAVGHPTAVNPDRALRAIATERGWPVLDFRRPVTLRSRVRDLPAPSGAVLAAAAIAAAGLALGAALVLRARRARA